MRIIMMIDFP